MDRESLPEIGGTVLHSVITPRESSVFKLTCEVCGIPYEATKETGSRHEKAALYRDSANLRRGVSLCTYEVVDVMIGVCPNCGHEREIGVIPSGKTFGKEHSYGRL